MNKPYLIAAENLVLKQLMIEIRNQNIAQYVKNVTIELGGGEEVKVRVVCMVQEPIPGFVMFVHVSSRVIERTIVEVPLPETMLQKIADMLS